MRPFKEESRLLKEPPELSRPKQQKLGNLDINTHLDKEILTLTLKMDKVTLTPTREVISNTLIRVTAADKILPE